MHCLLFYFSFVSKSKWSHSEIVAAFIYFIAVVHLEVGESPSCKSLETDFRYLQLILTAGLKL